MSISVVHREIDEILGCYAWGIAMSRWSCLERGYQQKFNRSLDYKSLGVKNIEELLVELDREKMALLIKEPERKEKYAISARLDLYGDQFKVKLNYHRYGLTDLDHLCEVFKDILVVGAANSGEKAIKAVVKPYNLSKRRKI
ncbi:endonuclease [Tanacetum coccineum]